jgi:hypothetical protein
VTALHAASRKSAGSSRAIRDVFLKMRVEIHAGQLVSVISYQPTLMLTHEEWVNGGLA